MSLLEAQTVTAALVNSVIEKKLEEVLTSKEIISWCRENFSPNWIEILKERCRVYRMGKLTIIQESVMYGGLQLTMFYRWIIKVDGVEIFIGSEFRPYYLFRATAICWLMRICYIIVNFRIAKIFFSNKRPVKKHV